MKALRRKPGGRFVVAPRAVAGRYYAVPRAAGQRIQVLFASFSFKKKEHQGFPSRANMFFLYASTPGWLKGLTSSRWPDRPQTYSKK